MSLNSALSAGTAGLLANSSTLAAISDNIANVNTTAYKRNITNFDPLVETQGSSTTYAAGGVAALSRQLVSQQGLLASSASPTDVAISGAGFFVVSEQAENLDPTDGRLFTRAGSFSPDENGFLRNTAGFYLQGWPVQPDGSIIANPTDVTSLETVNVSAIGGTAEATSRLQFNANLNSSTPVSAAALAAAGAGPGAAYSATANNMASGAVTPDFSSAVQIFDSQGGLRTLNYAFLKSNTPNQWFAEIYITPAADVVPNAPLVNGQVATGTIAFTSTGQLDPTAPGSTLPTQLAISAFDGTPPVDANGAVLPATAAWAPGTGIAQQAITMDLGGPNSTGGISQLASSSALLSSTVDGSVFGDLAGVEVNPAGDVLARFSNGIIRKVFQLPVATFLNPDGLQTQRSGGAYVVSGDSGQFTLKEAGLGGAGLISPNSLETSTVDLANEFTGMITTQRAYSAASRVITTADEMLEELIRIIR